MYIKVVAGTLCPQPFNKLGFTGNPLILRSCPSVSALHRQFVRNSPVALRLGAEMDPYQRDLTNILHSYLVSDSFGPVLGARA